MVRTQKAETSLRKSQKLEILWLNLKGLELLWVNPRNCKFYGQISKGWISMGKSQKLENYTVRSQKAGTSMGKSQKLEILWLDLKMQELLW